MIVKYGIVIDTMEGIDTHHLISPNGEIEKKLYIETTENFESVKQMAIDFIATKQIELGNAEFKRLGLHKSWNLSCSKRVINKKVQWDAFPNEFYNDKTWKQRKAIEDYVYNQLSNRIQSTR
jgi:hypothetical protein